MQNILFTSAKGGVGKSTVCANFGATLAKEGFRVLLVDLSPFPCVDVFLGCEERVVYTLEDVLDGAVPLSRAVVSSRAFENLMLLPGTRQTTLSPTTQGLASLCSLAEKELALDYILFDTALVTDAFACPIRPLLDLALVVATPSSLDARLAESAGVALLEDVDCPVKLLVNNFAPTPEGTLAFSFMRMIDLSSLSLFGVIPHSETLATLADAQILLAEKKKTFNATCAFANLSARLRAEHRPLLTGFRGISRSKLLHG